MEWHRGQLFPRVGFIVTNLSAKAKGVVHFYNGRGTAEQWIKASQAEIQLASSKVTERESINNKGYEVAFNVRNPQDVEVITELMKQRYDNHGEPPE